MGKNGVLLAVVMNALCACSTVVTSNAIAPGNVAWNGPVLVTESTLPAGVPYKVLGSVEADARAGYEHVNALYPLLAGEAKKLGANAVISAKGSHRVTAFSWAAPYVSGIAVKVDDVQQLKGVPGAYY